MKIFEKIKEVIKNFMAKSWFEDASNLVCYICGNEALPLPLTSEEEKILLMELANDNQVARDKLIEHNLRLVVFVAKKFESSGIDMEDLISVGAVGLIKAVKSYKLDKNIKLATYASRCIENEILMLLRKTTKRKGEISIDEPLGGGEGDNILLLSDILCNEDDEVGTEVEKGAEKEIIWGCLEHLNEREQEIMKLRFGLGGIDEKTQKEVAELLGISQSYISRIEKKILFRLRKDLLKIM